MSEEVKTEVKEETTKKSSWLSGIIVSVISIVVGAGATFGIISPEKAADITINTYVHKAATDAIGQQCEDIAKLIQNADKDIFKDKTKELVAAIKDKNFVKALNIVSDLLSKETSEKTKKVIEEIKVKIEKVKEIGTLLKNKDNEKLRTMFPDAVKEAKKYLDIEDKIVVEQKTETTKAATTETTKDETKATTTETAVKVEAKKAIKK